MPDRHADVIALFKQVLGNGYTRLHVKRVLVEEDLDKETTSVSCEVSDESEDGRSEGEVIVIAGQGVGAIDAFFRAMRSRYAEEYPSLKTIRFANFLVGAQLETKQEFAGTDSQAEVTIEIANSDDKRFVFHQISRSVIAAGIVCTLRGIEYFINSERAFVTTYHALKDAQARNRSDLVQRYTDTLATLVKNTSYSEVIDKISADMNG